MATPQAPVANGQLAALSGTVGSALNYGVPTGLFSDPAGLALTYSYQGLPAGLVGNGLAVAGSPTVAGTGTFTVTATNTAGLSVAVSGAYSITAPVNPPTSQPSPPVQVSPLPALSAQVGQPASYAVLASAFQDPANSPLTFSYQNLPAGLSGSGLTISGTPTAAGSGQFTVTVKNAAGLSVISQVSYSITTQTPPPSTGGLALVAPIYNCSTGAITFQTSGGDGTAIEFMSPGITGWSSNPNQFLDHDSRTASDTPPFTLYARQSGKVVTYTWSRQAYCSGTTPPTSSTTAPPTSTTSPSTTVTTPPTPPTPPTGSGLSWQAPLYDCSTGQFTFRTTGGNGTPVEYWAAGITAWTTTPTNSVDAPVRSDPPASIELHARQSGVEIATYSFNLKAFCSGTTPPTSSTTAPPTSTTTAPPTSTTSPSTTVATGALALVAPIYNCSTGAITFQTTGGNGSLIEFMSVGITGWSSNPNQFLDREARVDADTPPFTIYARQSGSVVSYTWSRQATCAGGARLAAPEKQTPLSVQVLGNPVEGATVEVLVTGAAGQSLTLEVVNLHGYIVHRQQIESAQTEERALLRVGPSAGILLLRVATPTQQQHVKLVKN